MACPICHRPTDARFRPFCSKRCADVDLARWFTGSYAIPAEVADTEADSGQAVDPNDESDDGKLH